MAECQQNVIAIYMANIFMFNIYIYISINVKFVFSNNFIMFKYLNCRILIDEMMAENNVLLIYRQ